MVDWVYVVVGIQVLFNIAVTIIVFLLLGIFSFLRKTDEGGISITCSLWLLLRFTSAKEIRWRSLMVFRFHLHSLELVELVGIEVIWIKESVYLSRSLFFVIALTYEGSSRFPQVYSIKSVEVRVSFFHARQLRRGLSKLIIIILKIVVEGLHISIVALLHRCLQILAVTWKPLIAVFFA